MTQPRRPARRWFSVGVGVIFLLLIGAACSWALMTVLQPTEDPLVATDHTYAEVAQGEVGASLSLNAIAKWTPVPAGTNEATGVLTSIDVEGGQEVVQGTRLYSVNLRPVVIAQGEVPAFRALAANTAGADVKQLQSMLAALGFYGGAIDGTTGIGTVRAIKDWQGSLGLDKSGVVELGDVVFVPTLPTRIALDTDGVQLGSKLVGGERLVNGLSTSPDFRLSVTETQATTIRAGTRIEITSPEGSTWIGVAADQALDSKTGAIHVSVSGDGGNVICGDECGTVPVAGEAVLPAKIIMVPKVTGLVVPSSALITTANGQTAVVDAEGTRIPVVVEASAKGMSVISGAEAGLKVRIPGSAKATP